MAIMSKQRSDSLNRNFKTQRETIILENGNISRRRQGAQNGEQNATELNLRLNRVSIEVVGRHFLSMFGPIIEN